VPQLWRTPTHFLRIHKFKHAPTQATGKPQESVEISVSSESQERVVKVPISKTERFIESSLLEKVGAFTKVTCPAKMVGQIGDLFMCLVENLTIPSDHILLMFKS
jgi:hypothetical protein